MTDNDLEVYARLGFSGLLSAFRAGRLREDDLFLFSAIAPREGHAQIALDALEQSSKACLELKIETLWVCLRQGTQFAPVFFASLEYAIERVSALTTLQRLDIAGLYPSPISGIYSQADHGALVAPHMELLESTDEKTMFSMKNAELVRRADTILDAPTIVAARRVLAGFVLAEQSAFHRSEVVGAFYAVRAHYWP